MSDSHRSALAVFLHGRGFHFSAVSLGEPFAGYGDFDACVSANGDKADPHAYCGTIKRQTEALQFERTKITVTETLGELQERIKEGAFSWGPDVDHLKEVARQNGGKFLLIEAIHPMVTDTFNVGHGSRMWTEKELMKTARTATGHGANINHEIALDHRFIHEVYDSEYNEQTKTMEMVVFESDPEVLRLIREGYITKVSIDGQARRETVRCDACGTDGCKCHKVPEGVMLGEDNGAAFAYVVTKEGATYYGRPLKVERPGDWNSKIHMVETNSIVGSGHSEAQMSDKIKEALLKTAEPLKAKVPISRLMEAINAPEKVLTVKEDLQAFNDAINSGDALRAVMIMAGDLYGGAGGNGGQQQQQPPAQGQQAPPKKPEETDAAEKEALTKEIDAKVAEALKTLPDKIKEALTAATPDIQKNVVAEAIKAVEPKIAEAVKAAPELKEVASIKESMGRLSTHVKETFTEIKQGQAQRAGKAIRETEGSTEQPKFDLERARAIANTNLQ